MSGGVGPMIERPAAAATPRTRHKTSQSLEPPALRLPEDRAFEVSTINRRLARMAEQAAPAPRRAVRG